MVAVRSAVRAGHCLDPKDTTYIMTNRAEILSGSNPGDFYPDRRMALDQIPPDFCTDPPAECQGILGGPGVAK
jgi:hypothetical protein